MVESFRVGFGGGLLRAFDDFDETPALVFAQRAGFDNPNTVTNIACILFIMSHEFARALDELWYMLSLTFFSTEIVMDLFILLKPPPQLSLCESDVAVRPSMSAQRMPR